MARYVSYSMKKNLSSFSALYTHMSLELTGGAMWWSETKLKSPITLVNMLDWSTRTDWGPGKTSWTCFVCMIEFLARNTQATRVWADTKLQKLPSKLDILQSTGIWMVTMYVCPALIFFVHFSKSEKRVYVIFGHYVALEAAHTGQKIILNGRIYTYSVPVLNGKWQNHLRTL